jgi:glycosyltransferase involved in cell wall biosynthesis
MLHQGDAVGRHALRLRDVLRARGIESRIYVETPDPSTDDETEHYRAYGERAQPGDVLVYQFATASGLAPWLAGRTEILVVNYHNVTPPEEYAAWDNGLARHQLLARQQLAQLARRSALAVAVSAFNQSELRQAGYAATAVVPPAAMLGVREGNHGAPPEMGARWISVGRLAPNKALQLAVMALAVTRLHRDPEATLSVVGRPVVPAYTAALRAFIDAMGLHDAVTLRGACDDDTLAAAMADADMLVMTSTHEGFGVPVVEAMAQGLPVVANRAAALPDIVGDGGLLADATDPYAFAGAVARILDDATLRARITDAGRAQVAALDLASAGDRLADLLVGVR